MAAPGLPARSAVCIGDPDAFASEMIKMINDKEFRSAKVNTSRTLGSASCVELFH